MRKYLYAILMLLITSSTIYSQTKQYYFYKPENKFGSDLFFNPFTVVINGTYDILRNGTSEKNIFKISYQQGFKNVYKNISYPAKNIERYGRKNFLKHEIWNFSFNMNELQFIPNYSHHIFGSGMQYVLLAEWYDYHNVKFPYFCSFLTTTLYQVLNEVVENDDYDGWTVDPVSDLLIFNPIGFLLFSLNPVKHFFSKTVTMNDWSLQPILNPVNSFLENAGQQYILKRNLTEKYSAFIYWGIYGIIGIGYTHNRIHNFSAGLGTVVNGLNEKRLLWTRILTPDVDGAAAFFYDRNNSLLTSVIITGPRLYNARINIYPGLIKLKWFTPGIFIGFGEWDNFVFGLTTFHFPLGLGYGMN